MAFDAQPVNETTTALSHVIVKYNSTDVGTVIEVGEIDTEMKTYEHKAANADGSLQVAAIFETEKPAGVVEVTISNVPDLDASTLNGLKTNVTLEQVFQKGTAAGHRYTAAKAYCKVLGYKPGKPGEPGQTRLRITPYNDPGTAAWTHTNAQSYA